MRARVAAYAVPLPDARLDAAIDLIVRVVLSHVMQPSASPEATADDIAWLSPTCSRADYPERRAAATTTGPWSPHWAVRVCVAVDHGADHPGEDELEVAGAGDGRVAGVDEGHGSGGYAVARRAAAR